MVNGKKRSTHSYNRKMAGFSKKYVTLVDIDLINVCIKFVQALSQECMAH